jgi:hypothetical protein
MAAISGAWLRKRFASLAVWLPSFHHVPGDARLRDLKPELEQFAVNARRAQKGFSMLIAGSTGAARCRSAVALLKIATSNASSGENRRCTNARASLAERWRGPTRLMETSDTAG